MKHLSRIIAAVFLLAIISGCATKDSIVLLPDPDGHVGSIALKPADDGGQELILDKAGQSSSVSESGKLADVKTLDEAAIEKIYGKALAAQPDPPKRFLLYFRFGSSTLTDESKVLLPEIAKAVQERKSTDVSVVGHTDTMGAARGNYRLSLKRAQKVADLLEKLGVESDILNVDSHGETRLLVPTGDNVSEPKNRRVEVTVR